MTMSGRTDTAARGFAALRSVARSAERGGTAPGTPGILRRLTTERERPRPGECCEMCSEPVGERHSHVANLDERRLLCTCRACYLLFTKEGAGARRLRAVPEEYAFDPSFALTDAQWDGLQIPVGLAFFFRQSDFDAFVACYPSPGGATESELDVAGWADVVAANPALDDLESDVEAALVRKRDEGGYECYRVPIDACYELVGVVRQHWVGFHGGDEVWARIEEFFDGLRWRCGAAPGGARDG